MSSREETAVGGITLSRQATYGAVKRKVTALRKRVSDYDAETDKLKRKAEREGGPAARFVVDTARSPKFHILRERLRKAEAEYAAWRPAPKLAKLDIPFGQMVAGTMVKMKAKATGAKS